ncbi:MAG: hypothetical protein WCQ03_03790, partial [Phycisphaerae bacterium]
QVTALPSHNAGGLIMTGCFVASMIAVASGGAGAFFESAAAELLFEAVKGAFEEAACSETVPQALKKVAA